MSLDIKKLIQSRIKDVCHDQKIDVKTLAKRINANYNTVLNYYSGRSEPKVSFLLALHELGYSLEWLMTGKGNMHCHPQDIQMATTRAELRSNDRKAQLQGFIDYYFEEYGEDEQAWLLIELKKQLPEFKDFLAKKDTDSSMQRHVV